jgi:hypothetical protein
MDSSTTITTIDPKGAGTIYATKNSATGIDSLVFRVSRAVIDDLLPGNDLPPNMSVPVNFDKNDVASLDTLEILLRCMHVGHKLLPPQCYSVPVREVWRVLTLVDITAEQHSHIGRFRVPCRVLRN